MGRLRNGGLEAFFIVLQRLDTAAETTKMAIDSVGVRVNGGNVRESTIWLQGVNKLI
jgi:hypothetical protein